MFLEMLIVFLYLESVIVNEVLYFLFIVCYKFSKEKCIKEVCKSGSCVCKFRDCRLLIVCLSFCISYYYVFKVRG